MVGSSNTSTVRGSFFNYQKSYGVVLLPQPNVLSDFYTRSWKSSSTGYEFILRNFSMASLLLGVPTMAALSSTLTSSLSFSKSQSLTCGSSLLSVSPASISLSLSGPNLPFIYCGRGDKKTARGKRFKHSFGNARPQKKTKGRGPPRMPAPPLPPRIDKYEELEDDGEDIFVELDESLESD